jgi:hypothetical protein
MKPIAVHEDNISKHGITRKEVRECLRSGQRQYFKRIRKNVYRVIAQTFAGRYLEVLYENRATEWFVFHAMDARPRDIKLFKRKGKRR